MTKKQIIDSLVEEYNDLLKSIRFAESRTKDQDDWEIMLCRASNLGYLEGQRNHVVAMLNMLGYELQRKKIGTYRAIKKKEE